MIIKKSQTALESRKHFHINFDHPTNTFLFFYIFNFNGLTSLKIPASEYTGIGEVL